MFLRALFSLFVASVIFYSSITILFKIVLIVGFAAALFFVDYVLVLQIPFFRFLTAMISLISMVSFILLVAVFLEKSSFLDSIVGPIIPQTKYLSLLFALVFAFYYSIRTAEVSDYFKPIVDNTPPISADHLVDTSAIIDGRLLEVCEAGFLSTKLIVPEFVVRELQYISDSFSHERRKKGRRGLDLLKRMKNSEKISVSILQLDFDFIKGVDNKLIHLSKERGFILVTNDYNLIKVAELQSIKVLSINKIATILRPMYAVGDRLKVNVLKKGSSKNQGVAYLEDDTMVVVEEGEKWIGSTKNVVVTQFIQSDSGKILFCRLGEYSL